jgi:hypothetical protein
MDWLCFAKQFLCDGLALLRKAFPSWVGTTSWSGLIRFPFCFFSLDFARFLRGTFVTWFQFSFRSTIFRVCFDTSSLSWRTAEDWKTRHFVPKIEADRWTQNRGQWNWCLEARPIAQPPAKRGSSRALFETFKRIFFRSRTSFTTKQTRAHSARWNLGVIWSISCPRVTSGLKITELRKSQKLRAASCLSSKFCWCLQIFLRNIQVPRHRRAT